MHIYIVTVVRARSNLCDVCMGRSVKSCDLCSLPALLHKAWQVLPQREAGVPGHTGAAPAGEGRGGRGYV